MTQQPGQPQRKGTDIVIQGRIVWGGVKQFVKNVYGTRTPAINPKTGEQIIEWAFGLAIPKPSPQSNQHEVANFQTVWNAIASEGAKIGFQQPGQPGFHWKFEDGDGRKDDGSSYSDDFKGCIVLACKTRIPLKLMAWENGKCVQVTEDQIKCGDYVQVALNISGHGNPNAGLYINPSFVARFAFGEAIVNRPDASAIFGATPPPIPFGGSATPMGGGFMQAPGFGGAPTVPGVQQPMAGYQQPGPAAPIQPNYGPLPGQFNPGQQGAVASIPGGTVHNGMAGPGVPQNTQAPQQQQQQVWQPPVMQGQAPQQQAVSPGYPAPMSQPMGPWQPPQG